MRIAAQAKNRSFEPVRPPGLSARARLKLIGKNSACVWGEFMLAGQRIAQVVWAPNGSLLSERHFDRHGRVHGLEISRHEDGSVEWQMPWLRGQMHGVARQRDTEGRDLYRSRFVRGSGVDLWVQGGAITEFREHSNSLVHGIERWGHPLLPSEEGHFLRGRRAGVFRRWSGKDLERGYPRYFIDDEEVTRSRYVEARSDRPELQPDRRRDDRRERQMPPALSLVWLRKEVRGRVGIRPSPDEHFGCG